MIQFAIDATGFAAVCGGLASIIAATSGLVWAVRRDPRSGTGSDIPKLPPGD